MENYLCRSDKSLDFRYLNSIKVHYIFQDLLIGAHLLNPSTNQSVGMNIILADILIWGTVDLCCYSLFR